MPQDQEIIAALLALLEKECASVDRAVPLTDQFNSLQILHFALSVQKMFSIRIADIEINEKNFASVESVARFVAGKLAVV